MSQIVIETEGAVRWLRMARPEKKNALTVAMYASLAEALEGADRDDAVRALVITGAPGVFTAGNDVLDFMNNPPFAEDSAVIRFLRALVGLQKPIVAAVDGPAVGIGTTMLLHCDLAVATPDTRFRMPFVPLGLVPEAASSLLLPMWVGMQRASEWLLLGAPFSADEAHRAGLVNRVVPSAELEGSARGFATALAELPPQALRASKALLRGPWRDQVQATIQREGQVFLERLRSAEAMQAFAAFAARKR